MTTEIFKAGTQYNDFTGTSAAETQGFVEYLKSKDLIKDDEFVLWIFLGGIWICLSHLGFGVLLCITVIGIPFGMQHFKLAALALAPFGKDIVES